MKRFAIAAGALLGGMALSLSFASLAAGPAKTAAAPADPPTVGSLNPVLSGFKWGGTHAEVVKIYNGQGGLFDQEYDPVLQKMQPGVRMQALEADRENRKNAFAASFLEFKDTPTGYDATGLKGEYTYRNHEEIMNVEKDGKRRFFFYIGAPPGERLWKIYDEVPLTQGGPLGTSYQEAVTKLNTLLQVAGRIRAADPSQNIFYTTADWQDGTSHLRAVDRSYEHIVGVVLEDRATLSALPQLRAIKPEDPLAMDPSISAITKGGVSDPNARRAAQADAGPKK